MVLVISSHSRIFLLASFVTLSLFWFDALRAQDAARLPDYVIVRRTS